MFSNEMRGLSGFNAPEAEFGARGRQLDAVLLAWKTNFLVDNRGGGPTRS